MKITFVFEVPYFIRTDSTNIFSISHDGFKSIIEIQNPDGFEYLPWLKGNKSASSGIIFGHTDENFSVNTEKNRSTIKISVKIGRKSLTSFPESKFTIFGSVKSVSDSGSVKNRRIMRAPYTNKKVGVFLPSLHGSQQFFNFINVSFNLVDSIQDAWDEMIITQDNLLQVQIINLLINNINCARPNLNVINN